MNLSEKYEEKFGHLEGVKSLGWGSDYSQQKRFDIFSSQNLFFLHLNIYL